MPSYSAGTGTIHVRPSLDGFATDLRNDLQRIEETYDVKIRADTTGFAQDLSTKLSAIDAKITVEVNPDTSGFGQNLATKLSALGATFDVEVNPDTTGFSQDLSTKLAALTHTSVKVKIDLEGASAAKIDKITAALTALKAVGDVTVKVDIQGDAAQMKAATRLKGLAAELDKLKAIGNVLVGVDIMGDADQMKAAARLKGVAAELKKLQQIGYVRCVIDIEVRGGAELLAVVAALKQIRDRRVSVSADTNSARSGVASLLSSLGGLGAVKFTGLVSAIGAIAPALLGAAGAAGGLAGVLGTIGGAGALGLSGLKDTFSALKSQSDSAGDAAQEMADKQQAVTQAVQDQQSAQRDLTSAQQAAKDANKDLADSYEDARRSLRDLNDELTDAKLNQEDAEISLAEAQQERNKTYADSSSTGLDKAKADNRVAKAQQRLKEAKSDTSDKTEDTAKANAKGIDGSDQVTAAKKKKSDADQAVVDAQNKLATAAYNLAKAQSELAKGTGAADKVAQAMAKLAPSAQDFVRQMQALGPSWTDMRKAVQERLFEGLGASVTTFANTNLPALKTGLSQVAGYMNGAFKQTLSGLSTEFANLKASGQWQGLLDAAKSALSGMAPMVTGITNALVTMGAAIGPALGPFFTQLGELIRTLGPTLGSLGNTLLTSLTSIMPTLGQFLTALGNGLQPVLPVLATLINALGQALIPLVAPLSQIAQIVGNTLAQVLPIVAPFFAQLAQLAAELLSAIAPLLPPLFQLASAILTPLVGVLRSVVAALAPFITQIVQFMGPVVAKITPILQQMGDTIAQGLVTAIQQILPDIIDFAKQVSALEQAFLPVLPELVKIAVDLLPIFLEGLRLILPPLTKWVEAMADLAARVVPLVVDALKWIDDKVKSYATTVDNFATGWEDAWSRVSLKVEDVAKWVSEKINDILNFVGTLKEGIRTKAEGAWDGMKESFKTFLNWLIKSWNDFSFTMKVPDNIPIIGGKGFTIDTPDLPYLSTGGPVRGPGGPTDDVIPIMGSNGEWMQQAAAVSYYGPRVMDDMNHMRIPRDAFLYRATGGPIGAVPVDFKDELRTSPDDENRWNTSWYNFFEKYAKNGDSGRDEFLSDAPGINGIYRSHGNPPTDKWMYDHYYRPNNPNPQYKNADGTDKSADTSTPTPADTTGDKTSDAYKGTPTPGDTKSSSKLLDAANRAVAAGEKENVDVAVQITDPDSSLSYFAGKSGAFPSASVIKLLVAAAAARAMDAGTLTAGQVKPVLDPMISQSSNEATNSLIDLLGGFGAVNKAGSDLGISDSDAHLGRRLGVDVTGDDPNVMSAKGVDALLTVFSKAARGKETDKISKSSATMIVDAMKNQQVNTKFGAVLDHGGIAHKTGELGGTSHDVGYFFDGERWLQVTILTNNKSSGSQDAGNAIIKAFATDVYSHRMEDPAKLTPATGTPTGQGTATGTAVDRANAFVSDQIGKSYLSPPNPPTTWDCSMLMSGIYSSLTGGDTNKRMFTTEGGAKGDFDKYGFVSGLQSGAFQIGVHRGGGGPNSHMAGTMPNGDHVESGGNNGVVTRGPSAAGADDSQFELHWSLPPSAWNPAGGTTNTPTPSPTPGGDPTNPYAKPSENRDKPQKYQPDPTSTKTTTGSKTTTSSTTWSGIAGSAVTDWVKDALGAFGIPDSTGTFGDATTKFNESISGAKSYRESLKNGSDKTKSGDKSGEKPKTGDKTGSKTPQTTAPQSTLTGVGGLTMSSSPTDVAKAIIGEARKRSYPAASAVAEVSTGLQESGLSPSAQGGGGAWHGIYQQDSGYPGRDDPNTQISGFFDRLDQKRSNVSGWSPDIWKNIFWLQQRPGETSADAAYANGRQAYLTEIQSQRGKAQGMFDQITGGVYDTGGVLRDGQIALNMSGHDEYVIPNHILAQAIRPQYVPPSRELAMAGAPAGGVTEVHNTYATFRDEKAFHSEQQQAARLRLARGRGQH